MWLKILCVAGGGALGALARFGVSTWMMGRLGAAFPWGTLAVNLIGCLLIGLFSVLLGAWPGQEQLKPLLITGFLGAMTTFSTFSLESWQHLEQGRVMVAATNMIVSCVVGLALVALGLRLGRALLALSANGG